MLSVIVVVVVVIVVVIVVVVVVVVVVVAWTIQYKIRPLQKKSLILQILLLKSD